MCTGDVRLISLLLRLKRDSPWRKTVKSKTYLKSKKLQQYYFITKRYSKQTSRCLHLCDETRKLCKA